MNTIKYLKENKIELNGEVYKPHTICNIPDRFGFNARKIAGGEYEYGIGEWFNYKGFTYIKE